MAALHVLDREAGDSKTEWDPSKPEEVEAARQTFERLKGKRYLAYRVDNRGQKGEVMREFDPQAGKIIMQPQMAGG